MVILTYPHSLFFLPKYQLPHFENISYRAQKNNRETRKPSAWSYRKKIGVRQSVMMMKNWQMREIGQSLFSECLPTALSAMVAISFPFFWWKQILFLYVPQIYFFHFSTGDASFVFFMRFRLFWTVALIRPIKVTLWIRNEVDFNNSYEVDFVFLWYESRIISVWL